MTYDEIVQALRCCEKEVCADGGLCPLFSDADCIVHLREAVTDLIERLTAENAALREKVALRGKQWRKIASDGTPQEKGYYIAFVERAVGEKPTVRQAYWTGQEWRSCEKRYKITPRVTHWRSMPEGPQEGEKV